VEALLHRQRRHHVHHARRVLRHDLARPLRLPPQHPPDSPPVLVRPQQRLALLRSHPARLALHLSTDGSLPRLEPHLPARRKALRF